MILTRLDPFLVDVARSCDRDCHLHWRNRDSQGSLDSPEQTPMMIRAVSRLVGTIWVEAWQMSV